MITNQHYFFLRMKDNFLQEDTTRLLRRMPDGRDYLLLLFQLYFMSVKFAGYLMISEKMPHTTATIAAIAELPEETVREAMGLMEQMGLMEVKENGVYFMTRTPEMVGVSSTEGDRKKRTRALTAEKEEAQKTKEASMETVDAAETDEKDESETPEKNGEKNESGEGGMSTAGTQNEDKGETDDVSGDTQKNICTPIQENEADACPMESAHEADKCPPDTAKGVDKSPDNIKIKTKTKTKLKTKTNSVCDTGEGSGAEAPAHTGMYGEYGNVALSQEELSRLRADFPDKWQIYIDRLSRFIRSSGKQYQSHDATIRRWIDADQEKERAAAKSSPSREAPEGYDGGTWECL